MPIPSFPKRFLKFLACFLNAVPRGRDRCIINEADGCRVPVFVAASQDLPCRRSRVLVIGAILVGYQC